MDRINIVDLGSTFLKKYRYALIVILAGILLLTLPTGESSKKPAGVPTDQKQTETPLEQSLSELLSMIKGAGKVKVLLTEAQGERILYQTDENRSSGEHTNDIRSNTVLITQDDRSETGLIKQRIPPVYQGAVILCQGADSAGVRLSIVEAVTSVTGLTSDKITVLRMK